MPVSMHPPLETSRVSTRRVACDGATDIPGGAALGHPRVFLQIDEMGYVDCGYCDRRFVLRGGRSERPVVSSLSRRTISVALRMSGSLNASPIVDAIARNRRFISR